MASAPKKVRKSENEMKSPTDEREEASFCERVNCDTSELRCCIQACDECFTRQHDPSEAPLHSWTHMSKGEHVCSCCVDFFTKTASCGYNEFYRWKKTWTSNSRSETSTLSTFISDELLPYWTQCIRCGQWRETGRFFKLNSRLAEQFICINGCDEAEDSRVNAAKEAQWINTLLYPPYLQQSPAAGFLKNYLPDMVGLSASETQPEITGADGYSRPFHEPPNSCHALGIRPDLMDYDETVAFPEFACAQQMYLCLRNLVLAMWVKNPSDWLTLDKCKQNVICRGLVRVRCIEDVERILIFLTRRSVIHYGILPHPPPSVFSTKITQQDVIIIGAGIAGLAAGQHLYKHGLKPVILEARDRLGGRVHASKLANGALLSLGADIISGSINNPISIAAKQAKLIVQEFPISNIAVFTKNNKILSAETMRKAENRFLEIVDLCTDWNRCNRNNINSDTSLEAKIRQINSDLDSDSDEKLSDDERLILNLHCKLLSIKYGCELSELSALSWNLYEDYPQFIGPSFVIKQGLGALLMKLAAGLTINYKKQAIDIAIMGDKVVVNCKDGESFVADKVICTAPLSCLKSSQINFSPPLPNNKIEAIQNISTGRLEKVVLHFKKKFWAPKLHGVRMFTSVSLLDNDDYKMPLFFDMSNNMGHILTAYFINNSVHQSQVDEQDIIKKSIEALHKVFPNAHEPISTSVSSWCTDSLSGSNACFIPVGCSDNLYEKMSQTVHGKIHFAGEATCAQCPHSMVGAYLSGVREAIKIID